MSILNQIYMISDVGCHKLFLWATVLFHRNCDCLVPEMFMFCSAVLFSLKKKQQNNYLCPDNWNLQFSLNSWFHHLNELCCQRQKKQKHCSCCSCRGLKSCASINSTERTSTARHLPRLTQCGFVMKYVLCHFYFCNKSHTVFIFRPVMLLCLHLHICTRNKWYWKLDKVVITSVMWSN